LVWGADIPTNQLNNATYRRDWIQGLVLKVKNTNTDGVNVDFEDPVAADSPERGLLTLLMRELALAFKSIPGTQVTYDAAWSPECIDGRCYDYKGISEAVDFLFVMDYDLRSQIFGPCIASANSPVGDVEAAMKKFIALGIDPSKLVLGIPWYGYDYPCINPTNVTVCPIAHVPFRGVDCSDAAGKEINFSILMEWLSTRSTTGRMWDDTLKSPWFSYNNAGQSHQVWYDDPQSLSFKMDIAKSLGLRGVGTWNADALDYSSNARNLTQQMWDTFRKAF